MSWSEIKYAVNNTLGTDDFASLDKMVQGGVQEFTSNGTFTVPKGVFKILITACAGGEGGSTSRIVITGGATAAQSRGGDGGEWIFKKAFNVAPNDEISITVGSGGQSGGAGGNTIIGNLITLLGGGVSGNMSGGKASNTLDITAVENTINGIYCIRATRSGAGFRDGESNSVSIYSQYYSADTDRDRAISSSGGGGSLGYGGSGVLGAGGSGKTNGGDGIVIIEW